MDDVSLSPEAKPFSASLPPGLSENDLELHGKRASSGVVPKKLMLVAGFFFNLIVFFVVTALSLTDPGIGYVSYLFFYALTAIIFFIGIVFWLAFGKKGKAFYFSIGMIIFQIVAFVLVFLLVDGFLYLFGSFTSWCFFC